MSLPRERPAFVLPWIGVILASFASLPLVFGGRSDDGGQAVDVPGQPGSLAGEMQGPQPAPAPALSVDGMPMPASAATGPQDVASFAGWAGDEQSPVEPDPETETAAEESPEGAPLEAAPVELPISPVQEPARQRFERSSALAVADRGSRVGALRSGSGAASGAPAEAPELLPALRRLADGRTELRLSPAAFAFVTSQGLLPRGVEIQPAVLRERDLPLLRAEAERLESMEEDTSGRRIAEERRQRLRRVKRLLASDPGRLVDVLARLDPADLRALVMALRGRGFSVDQVLAL